MKKKIADDYQISAVFYPIYSLRGQLMAVELISWLTQQSGNLSIPLELMIKNFSPEQRVSLLLNQIGLAEKHHDFFRQHNLHIAINIDENLAEMILESEFLLRKLKMLDCLELEVNEDFANLSAGKDNPLLLALSQQFLLSLHNFGAGKASPKAIYDNLFYRIKLDKGFIQKNINRLSFPPFFSTILRSISPYCQHIIVQGIDSRKMLESISQYPFTGIQCVLFPAVEESALASLV